MRRKNNINFSSKRRKKGLDVKKCALLVVVLVVLIAVGFKGVTATTAFIEEKRQEKIETVINKTIEEKGLSLFVFVVTDILNSNSEVIALGSRIDAVEKAFDKKLVNNRMFLEGVVSRKKQVLPVIDKNI